MLQGRPVALAALGTWVPPRAVGNKDLPAHLETSDEWISQRTGIRSRRIAETGTPASVLGIEAAREALTAGGIDPGDIDLVICASVSPDQLMPATAARIAAAVGARNAGAYDVLAGCTGFIYALGAAASSVAAGLAERVLVVGAEVISSILDWEDRSTCVLFGDGAGAAIVAPAEGRGRLLGFDLGNDGTGADLLEVPAGGSRLPASAQTVQQRLHFLRMNGREVYRFATRVVPESAQRILAEAGRSVDDVDLFVPHQANQRIIDVAAEKLGIPEDRVLSSLAEYGNTSCASIPISLEHALKQDRLHDGDLVLLTGFGAGLSWGSCLLEWGA